LVIDKHQNIDKLGMKNVKKKFLNLIFVGFVGGSLWLIYQGFVCLNNNFKAEKAKTEKLLAEAKESDIRAEEGLKEVKKQLEIYNSGFIVSQPDARQDRQEDFSWKTASKNNISRSNPSFSKAEKVYILCQIILLKNGESSKQKASADCFDEVKKYYPDADYTRITAHVNSFF
jgi:hypothetical protein